MSPDRRHYSRPIKRCQEQNHPNPKGLRRSGSYPDIHYGSRFVCDKRGALRVIVKAKAGMAVRADIRTGNRR